MDLYVIYNRKEDEIIVEEKYNGQVYHLGIQYDENDKDDHMYGNIVLYVNSKRKNRDVEMSVPTSTGNSLFHTYIFARNAYPLLEKRFIEDMEFYGYKKGIIMTSWLDNRRRDIYEKFLGKYGYKFGRFDGRKVLMKVMDGEEE